MTTLESTDLLAELYFRTLADLPSAVKECLVVKLEESLQRSLPPSTEPSESDFYSLFGAWEDDRTADDIVREIRESRIDVGQRAVFD